jgi:membrane-anchored glycerophosphoryl diester phosphodiesterase (GDPDase)
MYGLAYCFGIIFIIQPDNYMTLNITESIFLSGGFIVGGAVFYISFKLFPNAPNIITQKLAVKAIYNNLKKVKKTIYARK